MPPIVTLLTDFGTADGYVGEMKGALLSQAPNATIVDVSHDIPSHDIEMGRLALARYWRRFPAGTVHLVVVDPGVGTDRAALAISSDGFYLVGPDNGVLSAALVSPDAQSVSLSVPAHASSTFHGRDIFAPAAAKLALGASLDSLGTTVADPIIRRTPEPRRGEDGVIEGEVIAVDRFGNAITNLASTRATLISVDGRDLAIKRTYGDLVKGELGAVVGSSGLIEIVMREGRAADALRMKRGTRVRLR